ncbi:hypothetical protein DPMN_141400 [Dreissena polymorpha]|uniref:EGF-like domain-containing protein n=1 Tax=Dreissena polymorpha TaxID=45954 RepID=A0A9D4GFB4_DREPO|nr:hypothetical protein DPMN_141400 [Dreissena polymorpha]
MRGRIMRHNTCQCDNGWKWSSSQHKCIWDCTCPTGVQCMGPGVCACTPACRYGTCWNGQCECWEGYTGDRCDRLDKNTMMNRNISVGMNIEGLSYWSPELKFVDVAKLSSAWITQRDHDGRWDTHEQNNITWRNDGYPARLENAASTRIKAWPNMWPIVTNRRRNVYDRAQYDRELYALATLILNMLKTSRSRSAVIIQAARKHRGEIFMVRRINATAYYDYTRQIFEDLGTRAAHFKAYAITGYFGCDKSSD